MLISGKRRKKESNNTSKMRHLLQYLYHQSQFRLSEHRNDNSK